MSFQSEISKFPKELVQQLRDTMQNLKYHPEGSVYNHIYLVYESIRLSPLLINYKDLLICALFHDLGKIDATREKIRSDGKIALVAYGHENYTKDYLDKYLHLFEYDNKDLIYEVCQNHMRAHLFDRMRTGKQQEFIKNKYSDQTLKFSVFDDMSKKANVPYFIMTIGIPGSGKSTIINKLALSNPNYRVVCPDNIRKEITGQISDVSQDYKVWQIVKERVVEALKEEKNCILDSTMVKGKSRRDFIKDLPLCYRYAQVFEINPEKAKSRIKNDIENKVDRSNVPMGVIDRMYNNFERDKDTIYLDGFEII
jgi:predicted kinase